MYDFLTQACLDTADSMASRLNGDSIVTGEAETVVVLQGSLSLRDADEIRQRLEQSFESEGPVALDVRELVEVDISILQLIIAARASAMHRGVELRLIKTDDGTFQDAWERFGLLEAQP